MSRILLVVLFGVIAAHVRAGDLSVSIQMGQPGFYGRIDIGDIPHPELIFPQPVIIKPVVGVVRAPVYLHVPPGHAKDWGKHCHKYNACGERVFFVHEHWYNGVYVPQYQKKHGKPSHSNKSHGNKSNGKAK